MPSQIFLNFFESFPAKYEFIGNLFFTDDVQLEIKVPPYVDTV